MMKVVSLGCLTLAALGLTHTLNGQGVDVDLSHGSPQVVVPLFELSDRDFSVPINLYYESSGVKPSEPYGMFGTGWDWNLKTHITRVLRGLPDEVNSQNMQGWKGSNIGSTVANYLLLDDGSGNYPPNSNEQHAYTFLSTFSGTVYKDPEPDLFIVSAPGLSITFLYDNSGNIKTLSPFDGTIVPTITGNHITQIVVTTQGHVYTFSLAETTTMSVSDLNEDPGNEVDWKFNLWDHENTSFSDLAAAYHSRWCLTSITTMGGANIQFHYNELEPETPELGVKFSTLGTIQNIVYVEGFNGSSWASVPLHQMNSDFASTQVLRSITTSQNGKVSFEMGQKPISGQLLVSKQVLKPTNQEGLLMNEINFYATDGAYKGGILFDTKHYSASQGGNSYFRGFLEKILFDSEGIQKPLRFEYYNLNNGANLIPGNTTKLDRFGFPSSKERHSGGLINGSYDPDLILVGMLRTVRHTNGGVTELQYEPNTYLNEANLNEYGGGLRVSRITTKGEDGQEKIVTYQYNDTLGKSTGVLLYIPKYHLHTDFYFNLSNNQILSDEQLKYSPNLSDNRTLFFDEDLDMENSTYTVGYQKVRATTVNNGYVEYEYTYPKEWDTYTTTFLGVNWSASKVMVARHSITGTYAPVTRVQGYDRYPYPPSHTLPGMSGLLSRVSAYNNSGTLTSRTTYSYRLNTGGISYVEGLRIETLPTKYNLTTDTEMFVFSFYNIPVNATLLMEEEEQELIENGITLSSSQIYSYENDVNPLLRETSSIDSKGEEQITRMRYIRDLNFTSATGDADELRLLNENGFGRMPIETLSLVVKDNVEYLKGASTSTFDYNSSPAWFYPKASYVATFTDPVPLSQFSQLNVTSGTLTRDGTYRLMSTSTHADLTRRNVYTTRFDDLVSSTVVFSNKVPVGRVSNASATNIGFMSFEEANQVFDPNVHFSINTGAWSGAIYSAGRLDKNSLNITTGTGQKLSRQITASYAKYVVSFWAQTPTACNIQVVVGPASSSIPITTGGWKYYEVLLDVSGTFTLELNPTGAGGIVVNLDEVWSYPADAEISYDVVRADDLLMARMGEKGKGIYFEYDLIRRPTVTRDDKGYVLNVVEYGAEPLSALNILFNTRFLASGNIIQASPLLPGATYTWDAESGVNANILSPHLHDFTGIGSTTYQFAAPANGSTIFLKVVYNGVTYYKAIYYGSVIPF